MTIDGLAVMVKKGFDETAKNVNARFEQVDARFVSIDKRFISIEKRLDRMEIKLDSLERRIFAIENILTEHGRDIREIKSEIKKIRELGNVSHEKILELEQRVKILEAKITL